MPYINTHWLCVQELLEDGLVDQFHKSLVELNMDSAEELQSYIHKLQVAVEQGRQKLLQSDGVEGKAEAGVTNRSISSAGLPAALWLGLVYFISFKCHRD